MPDTVRSKSDILTLLADNTSRAISPQDLRDALVSIYDAQAIYGVKLSQTGTAAPVETHTKTNYLTGQTWSRTGVGTYRLSCTSAFTADKTHLPTPNFGTHGTSRQFAYLHWVDASTLELVVSDALGNLIDTWSELYMEVYVRT